MHPFRFTTPIIELQPRCSSASTGQYKQARSEFKHLLEATPGAGADNHSHVLERIRIPHGIDPCTTYGTHICVIG